MKYLKSYESKYFDIDSRYEVRYFDSKIGEMVLEPELYDYDGFTEEDAVNLILQEENKTDKKLYIVKVEETRIAGEELERMKLEAKAKRYNL